MTLSSGSHGEYYLAVNGKGKSVTLDDMFAVARETSIKASRARAIAYDVTAATIAAFKRETGEFNAGPASASALTRRRRPT